MNYAYDILLNFTDEDRFVDFFEWKETDIIDHIKKIPIFYIFTEDLLNLFSNIVKIDKSFLLKIKHETECYDNKNYLEYACLFSDGNKAIALEFNSAGLVISRSSLLLDEEIDIIDETMVDEFIKIKYEIIRKDNNTFLTREEKFKRKYLLVELKSIKDNLEIDKLNYLYNEVFGNNNLSFNKKIDKMVKDININYNKKYDHVYELLRFMHMTSN